MRDVTAVRDTFRRKPETRAERRRRDVRRLLAKVNRRQELITAGEAEEIYEEDGVYARARYRR